MHLRYKIQVWLPAQCPGYDKCLANTRDEEKEYCTYAPQMHLDRWLQTGHPSCYFVLTTCSSQTDISILLCLKSTYKWLNKIFFPIHIYLIFVFMENRCKSEIKNGQLFWFNTHANTKSAWSSELYISTIRSFVRFK